LSYKRIEVIQEVICVCSILEVSDAYLKVWGTKGEKKLCVIDIEAVI